MQTLTQMILDQKLANHALSDSQIARLVEGSDQRRYHLVNRAMKAEELVRLKRGLYVMAPTFRAYPLHPFAIAQALQPGSYVSLESALAFHGWIPESVYTTASISPANKSSELTHPQLGKYTFQPLATKPGHFLELVAWLKRENQPFLVARPIRALMDLVYVRNLDWQGMGWLTSSMRIDEEQLRSITSADIRILKLTYKQQRMQRFLTALAQELGND
ncbi:MAG: hypothetical protein RQ757_00575 [Pseudomonadales bacterium]|nr:hypothetical protein [Pseudomonadales bacterium]